MLSTSRTYSLASRWTAVFRYHFTAPRKSPVIKTPSVNEYTEVAEYPEIHDLSFTARKRREALNWHQEVQKCKTIEEKMIKINMPRYYGYKVVLLNDERLPYNCLPAIQYYTRTLYEDMASDEKEDERLASHLEEIKVDVQDALELSFEYLRLKYSNHADINPQNWERITTQVIVEQINRVLINALSADYQHLQDAEVDCNPRHEAFWSVGGIQPPKNIVRSKEGRVWQKSIAKEPIDRLMQYKSRPILTIRHTSQLPTWKNEDEYRDIEKIKNIPRIQYDPKCLGFMTGYQFGTNIPGYWPSNLTTFGMLSYQSRAGFHIRPHGLNAVDHTEALHGHAIQSSFAWLLAQANYNGFNTFNEITYPMNTQTIITDGKSWSFYEYQLNTLLMNGNYIDDNACLNYCRGTPEMKLYQDIDDKGKIQGLNDQVLKLLIKFYTNTPNVKRSPEELQPFLDATHRRVADYEDDEKRDFLDKRFKYLSSNRPRHLEIPEIYLWEKIYKIDHNTRPLDPRRRFFELFINPWKRTLDQHQKVYIPRALRAEGHRSRKKWKPTFYP